MPKLSTALHIVLPTVRLVIIGLALTVVLRATPSIAAAMTFNAYPPLQPFQAYPPLQLFQIFGNAWTIYAVGDIDLGAGERLQELITRDHIPEQSMLILNSPGGNLVGGIKLGQVIRGARLLTYVGRNNGGPTKPMLSGECYSACTLAFLGGEYRYIEKGSVFGVHRFYFSSTSNNDSDLAQMLSASIVQYIRDMEVDPQLFAEMTTAGKDEITIIPEPELKRLNVINNGEKATTWTIESMKYGIYLKGQRETVYGINKFILSCTSKGGLALYVIFDPQGRSKEVLQLRAYSLFVNGKAISLDGNLIRTPTVEKGWINAVFVLDKHLIEELENARTVGVGFQYTHEAPFFLGFEGMDFSGGLEKLPGILRTCGPSP